MEKKNNKIPNISAERLNSDNMGLKNNDFAQEKPAVKAFIKGRPLVQAITLRFPSTMYKQLREVAFFKEEKINKIIVSVVEEYLKNEERKKR